jgi:sodium-dependent dicarboxylate transporter 2/3/5
MASPSEFLKMIGKRKQIRQALAAVLSAVAVYFLLPPGVPEPARRTAAVFVIAAFFWALEIIPLYATSLLVVLLETFLLCRPGGVLDMAPDGYKIFMLPFGSPVIILFFGGFVLAQAMQKYHLDRMIASRLLKLFGSKPYSVMFGFMLASAFLSMWMSNTATTAMMVAMIIPLLRQMDERDPFRTGLILSIPFAANIGGIATPVGTPPNAIAIGILADHGIHISFIDWMKMAFPLAIILVVVTSVVLYFLYPSNKSRITFVVPQERVFDHKAKLTVLIVILTVVLWLTSNFHKIPSSLVGLLAAGLFAAFGLLSKDDFKNIDWDVLILMWGGLALGVGMEISGLTQWVIGLPLFQQHGFVLVAVFCLLAVVFSTFMSNTATANLLIPVVMAIPGESPVLLATTVALSCSLAMALPVSTPPNAIAFATNMLHSRDMLKAGVVVSLISVALVLLGFKFVITRAFGLP